MKHILTVLFAIMCLIAIFVIAFIIAPDLINPVGFVVAEDKENEGKEEVPSFRIYTKAVCENATGFVICQDELFASCEGLEYRLPKNEVNGKGIFDKGWKDPRNS